MLLFQARNAAVQWWAMGDLEHACGCLEPTLETREQWVYKGPGKGSYLRVGSLQLVGQGQGDFEQLGLAGSFASASGELGRYHYIVSKMDINTPAA